MMPGTGTRIRGAAMAALATLLLAGCGGGLPRERLEITPDPEISTAIARISPMMVELDQPAHVLVLHMTYPTAAEPGRPILFDVGYPAYPTDRRRFPEGTHRLRARARAGFWPMDCRADETPTIDGCRRPHYLLPGAGRFIATRPGHWAAIVIASAEFVDPYPLAEQLYWELLQDWQRAERLVDADIPTVTEELEEVLARLLGERGWAASIGSAQH